jgi:hypothetical protein
MRQLLIPLPLTQQRLFWLNSMHHGADIARSSYSIPWDPPLMKHQSLAPKYEQLAKVFAGEADVVIANVDATENNELATR